MIKHVLSFTNVSTDDSELEQLCQCVSLLDSAVLSARAFDLWRDSQKSDLLPALDELAANQFKNGLLDCSKQNPLSPVLMHHVNQRLSSENAQLFISAMGADDGRIVGAPLVQTRTANHWYSNSGLSQRAPSRASRKPLHYAMHWTKEQKAKRPVIHWVQEPTNELWQHWQKEKQLVMSLVAPSTRCWYAGSYTNPNAIAKQLDFYALNLPKMALPYRQVNASRVSDFSYWYAHTPIELRTRSGPAVQLQLFIVQLLDAELKEVKTYFSFCLIDQKMSFSPEQMAVWLLQHTESKQFLRLVGRAYHHKTLRSFAKKHYEDKNWLLELACLFGGAAWEIEQYERLVPLARLMLQIGGANALNTTQLSSSLLKLFTLKELLQQA